MIELTILLFLAIVSLVVLVYLFGFRMGWEQPHSPISRVRLEVAEAARQMHDVTRNAFVAMAEEAQSRRRSHNQVDEDEPG